MDAKAINKFPIREYLASRGIRPAKDRSYCGLYHSPLREDHMPSMKVDYDKNLWIDYGAGEGGTLIDLVMHMERCDAGEAMRRLEQWIDGGPISSFIGKNTAPQRPPSGCGRGKALLCLTTSWSGASTLIQLVCIVRRCIIA